MILFFKSMDEIGFDFNDFGVCKKSRTFNFPKVRLLSFFITITLQ